MIRYSSQNRLRPNIVRTINALKNKYPHAYTNDKMIARVIQELNHGQCSGLSLYHGINCLRCDNSSNFFELIKKINLTEGDLDNLSEDEIREIDEFIGQIIFLHNYSELSPDFKKLLREDWVGPKKEDRNMALGEDLTKNTQNEYAFLSNMLGVSIEQTDLFSANTVEDIVEYLYKIPVGNSSMVASLGHAMNVFVKRSISDEREYHFYDPNNSSGEVVTKDPNVVAMLIMKYRKENARIEFITFGIKKNTVQKKDVDNFMKALKSDFANCTMSEERDLFFLISSKAEDICKYLIASADDQKLCEFQNNVERCKLYAKMRADGKPQDFPDTQDDTYSKEIWYAAYCSLCRANLIVDEYFKHQSDTNLENDMAEIGKKTEYRRP